jgi:hypothetical protein
MSPENAMKLTEEFPLLYEGEGEFHFECEDGWYDIIHDLSAEIEHMNLTNALFCRAVQVKEKFGALRFYATADGDPKVSALIQAATNESAKTCERCGAPGALRDRAWLKTWCEKCNSADMAKASRR